MTFKERMAMTFEERIAHVLVSIKKGMDLQARYGSDLRVNDWWEAFEEALNKGLIERAAWRYYVTPAGRDFIEEAGARVPE